MKLCEQRISANFSLLVYKVCQIYAVRVTVSDNVTNRGKLSPPPPSSPHFFAQKLRML